MHNAKLLELSGMLLGMAVTGTLLSAFWFRATTTEPIDRDTVIFFAKIFFGIALTGILFGVLMSL